MKIYRPNPGLLIIFLGVASFFSVILLSKLQESTLFSIPFEVTIWGSIISLVALLALCLASARVMLWAYSKIQLPQHPVQIFMYGFLISIVGIFIGIVPGILQGQYYIKLIKDRLPNLSLPTGYTNFLSTGFEPLLLTCAITTIILLWAARMKKIKDIPAALFSHTYRRYDILLIISTLIVYAVLVKNMLEFIVRSLTFWGLAPLQ